MANAQNPSKRTSWRWAMDAVTALSWPKARCRREIGLVHEDPDDAVAVRSFGSTNHMPLNGGAFWPCFEPSFGKCRLLLLTWLSGAKTESA
jgi:hypothetical protein